MITEISISVFLVSLVLVYLFVFIDFRKKRLLKSQAPISIIVPCFNDRNSIEDTVNSIYSSYDKDKIDLIVVNDKSTDDSKEVIEGLRKKYHFTFINHTHNVGKAESVNSCCDLAKHEILFIIDADMIVTKRCLNSALARLQNKKVGAVSCPYKSRNKGFLPLMQQVEYNMLTLVQGSYNLFSAVSLWGGFIAVKKRAFLQVNKFSVSAITEDIDLAFKLNEAGWKVEQSFSPIETYAPDTLSSWAKQKIRWNSGAAQCYIKHFKVWIRNPTHIMIMLSFNTLMVTFVYYLIKDAVMLSNIIDYFSFLNETFSLIASLKLTGVLYGTFVLKDLLWKMLFTGFSIPYVIPLIKKVTNIYKILIVIPYSIIYTPMFSIVSTYGLIAGAIKYKYFERRKRAW